MSEGVDVLMLGTHPDDVEISCGGTILQFVELGRTVVVADLTRGEKATRGTAEIRATECEAASRMLNIKERINLELPDTELRDREPALRREGDCSCVRWRRAAALARPDETRWGSAVGPRSVRRGVGWVRRCCRAAPRGTRAERAVGV